MRVIWYLLVTSIGLRYYYNDEKLDE